MDTKITKFDRAICKSIQADLYDVMKPLCEKYGITVSYLGGKFSDLEFSPRLELKVQFNDTGIPIEQAEFERYCRLFGLPSHAYRQTVKAHGREVRIVGFNLSRPKFCILTEDCLSGKRLLYSREILKSLQSETLAQS